MYFIIILLLLIAIPGIAQPPKASFTSNITSGCSPLTVNFIDQSSGNPQAWSWDFGNGNTSTLQNPSAIYTNPGAYPVKLAVSNTSGGDIITKTKYITVFKSPAADFISDITTGCVPLSVNFTDKSDSGSSALTSWYWSFGDGNNSTAANTSHTYNAAATFDVSLTVINANGCNNTKLVSGYLTAKNTPQANFTANPTNLCAAPLTVNFTDMSTPGSGTVNSWTWNFGDGAIGNVTNPPHTYTNFGHYNISLIIKDNNNCADTVQFNDYIKIDDFKADFSLDTSFSCPDLVATFADSSTPNPVSWFWNFGDGVTTSGINPSHTYTSSGNFTVTLIANNVIGCTDTVIKSSLIKFQKINASFEADSMDNCELPFKVNFANNSSGEEPLKYLWNFGDGSPTDTNKVVSHTYTSEGSYKASLNVVDVFGCTNEMYMGNLQDSIFISKPFADVNGNTTFPMSGCIPLLVSNWGNTSNSKVGTITGWQWNFGDPFSGANNTSALKFPTHTYDSAGSYTVTLSITTDRGCTDDTTFFEFIKTGYPPDTVAFAMQDTVACHGESVGFTDLSVDTVNQWVWLASDGSSSTFQNPSIIFKDTGFITITFNSAFNNCFGTLVKDTIYMLPPKPIFLTSNSIICSPPQTITFTDKSYDASTWLWDFGDGTSSTDTNPSHTYTNYGVYNVNLLVTNPNGCIDSTDNDNKVGAVIVVPEFITGFTADDTASCFSLNTNITDTSKMNYSSIREWFWELGDGATYYKHINDTNNKNPPTHTYSDTGKYNIRLIITDDYFCKDTLDKIAYLVVNGVFAGIGVDSSTGCAPHAADFTDASVGSGLVNKWSWSFGDGSSLDTTQNPSHTYNLRGSYDVSLSVTDTNGCTDDMQKNAFINPTFPYPSFNYKTPICIAENIGIANTSTGTGMKYFWDFGDSGTDTLSAPIHTYADSGLYVVTLLVTDTNGCDSTFTQIVNVVTFPVANYGVDTLVTDCPPLIVNFTDSSSNDAISWYWDFGDGGFSTTENPVHYFSSPDTFSVTLVATNATGCKDTVIKSGLIKVGGPKGIFIFSPNFGCVPLNVEFEAVATTTIKFKWDFGDGNVDTLSGDTLIHTYMEPGNPNPKLLITDALGCEQQATGPSPTSITIDDPITSFTSNYSILCNLDTVLFTDYSYTQNNNVTITNRFWRFGDGDSSMLNNPSHYFSDTGKYIITLTTVTSLGCTTSESRELDVYIGPVYNIGISDFEGCVPFTISFIDSSQYTSPLITRAWNYGDGSPVDTIINPTHTYSLADVYNVHLVTIYGDNNCSMSGSPDFFVEAYDPPDANFDIDSTSTEFENIRIFFFNQSVINGVVGLHEYYWDFGDTASGVKNLSINEHPYHTFSDYGKYTIQLIVSNDGCSDTIYKTFDISYNEFTELFIPNVFTPFPSSPGNNDFFRINGLNKNTQLLILDRWGKMVFDANNYQNNWDGGVLADDTYYYILKDKDNEKIYRGYVQILRSERK